MVLTVDVGNTNIMLGGFEGNELLFVARVATDDKKTEDEYAGLMLSILNAYNVDKNSVCGAIVSSVVPQITATVKKARAMCPVQKPCGSLKRTVTAARAM